MLIGNPLSKMSRGIPQRSPEHRVFEFVIPDSEITVLQLRLFDLIITISIDLITNNYL